MRFPTKAIHEGQEPDPRTGSVTTPLFLTSTYSQKEQDAYEYARSRNPTREALEKNLAALEGGRHGLAFGSGMAAISSVMGLLKAGDHVVSSDDVYGGTFRVFQQVFREYGLKFDFVDATDLEEVAGAVRDDTRMIWMESPTNPLLKVVDLDGVAEIAQDAGCHSVMDNTFASPYLQRPLEWGFDIVVHSTTKYLGGHSDVIGGAVVTSDEDIHERLRFVQNAVGAIPSPFDCWLVLRGVKTLALRMDRHCENAAQVAEWLEGRDGIERVIYPGLESHPQHGLALEQMRDFGGIVSFIVEDAEGLADRLKSLEVITFGESLGGVESLIEHPASMTHASMPAEEREARGVSEGLVRLSVGIEAVEDLIEDLGALF
jgi:cystathionine beta-lyase/cystathionine gamma-synthase